MIDFRYHLVSIVAVFLALAIGIVVGATALKPKVEEGLDNASRHEQHQIAQNRTTINNLKNQISADNALAEASAPRLLAGLLQGQRVVLITAPGADGATITGITKDLGLAGAKVAGQVQLQPSFFDTSATTENSLDELATKVAPTGVTPGYPSSQAYTNAEIAGQQEAAQVLAPALVTKDATDLPASETSPILDGFAQQNFVQFTPSSAAVAPPQATLAVVVIPGNPPATDASPQNLALLSLAQELAMNGRGVVVAGSQNGSGTGSAIDELTSGNTGIKVSSVDDADTPGGEIIVAQALSYAMNGQTPKPYGADSQLAPNPAPTASPTPSPSTSQATSPVRKTRG
ncbi:MAG TPA: copper transporter [Streptosporangiaceae bacterium]|nr:copper transporter [Streptosporangiaceae bacterium]